MTVGIVDELERGLDALDRPFNQLERNIRAAACGKIGNGIERLVHAGAPTRRRTVVHVSSRTRRASIAFRRRASNVLSSRGRDGRSQLQFTERFGILLRQFEDHIQQRIGTLASSVIANALQRAEASASAPSPTAFTASAVATMCLQKPQSVERRAGTLAIDICAAAGQYRAVVLRPATCASTQLRTQWQNLDAADRRNILASREHLVRRRVLAEHRCRIGRFSSILTDCDGSKKAQPRRNRIGSSSISAVTPTRSCRAACS